MPSAPGRPDGPALLPGSVAPSAPPAPVALPVPVVSDVDDVWPPSERCDAARLFPSIPLSAPPCTRGGIGAMTSFDGMALCILSLAPSLSPEELRTVVPEALSTPLALVAPGHAARRTPPPAEVPLDGAFGAEVLSAMLRDPGAPDDPSLRPPAPADGPDGPLLRIDTRRTPCVTLLWTPRPPAPSSASCTSPGPSLAPPACPPLPSGSPRPLPASLGTALGWTDALGPLIAPRPVPSPSEMRRAADALLRTLADASAAGMVGDLRVAEARPLLPGEDPARRVRWLAARPDGTVAAALTLTPRRAPVACLPPPRRLPAGPHAVNTRACMERA